MKTLVYVGDIHGNTQDLGSVIQSAEQSTTMGVQAIIQVGDFGYGFKGRELELFLEKRARRGTWTVPIYTCFGNHDNWDLAYRLFESQGPVAEIIKDSGCYYVHRSHCMEIAGIKHLFLGGACSTDKYDRTEGVNWWHREEPDSREFDSFYEAFDNYKPDTVVTHDAPLRVDMYRAKRQTDITSNMLENVMKYSDHKPSKWYFGHHHLLKQWEIEGTEFFCCGLGGQRYHRLISNNEDTNNANKAQDI